MMDERQVPGSGAHSCLGTALPGSRQFLPHLAYLVVTAALNPATHGLLGERELRLLPRSAVMLYPARAQLIDEAALRRAVQEG